ncbi:MAG TPA: aminotransferase class III-fold pyridoxal phosphate-dependent enzyme, partial [Chloroflexia bacterium]
MVLQSDAPGKLSDKDAVVASEHTPDIKGPLPGPRAQAVFDRDYAVISPSYTRSYPFVMGYGKGCMAWDVDGNRFIDFTAGIAVLATGHAHPEVVRAVQEQAAKYIHMAGTDFYLPEA